MTVGWVASLTVNVSVSPSSTGTLVRLSTRPEESSSSSTSTVHGGAHPSRSRRPPASRSTTVGTRRSAPSSCTPNTVTVRAAVPVRRRERQRRPRSHRHRRTCPERPRSPSPLAVGWVASFTVNVSLSPSSTGTLVRLSTRPAVSSSVHRHDGGRCGFQTPTPVVRFRQRQRPGPTHRQLVGGAVVLRRTATVFGLRRSPVRTRRATSRCTSPEVTDTAAVVPQRPR